MGGDLDRTLERHEGKSREVLHFDGAGGWTANVYDFGKPYPVAVGQGDTREAAREDVGLPAKEPS